MAFQGYLMKFGGLEFPNRYLVTSSYKITPNQRLEKDAFRDANYLLHRETLGSYKTKIDFTTRDNFKLQDKINMFNVFKSGLLSSRERKYAIEYWNDETSTYCSGNFYMPDVEFTIKKIQLNSNSLIYDPIRIAFIEY